MKRVHVIAWVALGLLVGGSAAGAAGEAGSSAAHKMELQQRVKDGLINPGHCVEDDAVASDTDVTVTLHNTCDNQVNVTLCSWTKGSKEAGRIMFLLRAKTASSFRIPVSPGVPYGYRFNSCNGSNCQAPAPDC